MVEVQGGIQASLPLLKVSRLLNRHWSQWATEALTYISSSGATVTTLIEGVSSRFTNVNAVRLRQCEGLNDNGVLVLGKLQRLAHLDMQGCALLTMASLSQLSILTNLSYIRLPKDQGLGSIGTWMSKLENLKSACLSCCGPISSQDAHSLARVTSLTHLEVRLVVGFLVIANNALESLAKLTNLTHLGVQNCQHVSHEGAQHLTTLTHLTHLCLSQCWAINDKSIEHIASLSDLRHLDLNGCREISDTGVCHLSTLAELRYLDLSGCRHITDDGVWYLSSLTYLTHLRLVGCRQMTDMGILSLVKLKQLRHLDLSWCLHVTHHSIGNLTCLTNLTELEVWGCPVARCLDCFTARASLQVRC